MSEMQNGGRGEGVTDFVLERTCSEDHPESEKNRASLANKATMSVNAKTLQLDIWTEMFSVEHLTKLTY